MKIVNKYTTLLLSLCAAFTACSDNEVLPENTPTTGGETGEKTPIELSVGGMDTPSATTRAVITDGTNKTMQTFDVGTKIFFVMKSEKEVNGEGNVVEHNGYEYKGDRGNTLYTVCRGEVSQSATTTIDEQTVNTVSFPTLNQHYWDDAHARSSQLSIWAYAQKGQSTWNDCYFQEVINSEKSKVDDTYKNQFTTASKYYDWQTTEIYPAIREWNAMLTDNPSVQTAKTVECQDLLFSNNLTYNSEKSWPDNRLKFNFETKKFPTGATTLMKFYHAMSKITIQIKAGDGFKADGTDFTLANNKSIDKLSGFNTKGLFNIKDGEFQMIHERTEITSISKISEKTGKSEPNYILEALAVPNIHQFMVSKRTTELSDLKDEGSRFVENGTNVMIQFTIDGNTYKISSGLLYNSLKELTEGDQTNQIHKYTDNGNYIPMEAGKNYVFTFTIGKEQIQNISANLADWVNVTAEEITPSNAYVKLSLKTDEGTAVNTEDPKVDLYRAVDPTTYTGTDYNTWAQYGWETGYTVAGAKATLGQTSATTVYNATDASSSEQWYWPNNNTFYHFRTINKGLSITSGNNDVVSLYSGPINDTYSDTDISKAFADAKYNDYIWGAPFKSSVSTATVYSPETGFCNNATKSEGQLYKGIGSTKDNILLIEHHMMSNIYVDLETTTGTDQVNLVSATVNLVRYAKEAKLQMGNGLVTSYSNYDIGTGTSMTVDTHAAEDGIPAYDYSYRVVPQSMTNTSNGAGTKVGIVITAADGNVYIIEDLSKIKESGKSEITEWLPGKKYYYKFVLKKTGIDKITATVVDWEKVIAAEEEVTIK